MNMEILYNNTVGSISSAKNVTETKKSEEVHFLNIVLLLIGIFLTKIKIIQIYLFYSFTLVMKLILAVLKVKQNLFITQMILIMNVNLIRRMQKANLLRIQVTTRATMKMILIIFMMTNIS